MALCMINQITLSHWRRLLALVDAAEKVCNWCNAKNINEHHKDVLILHMVGAHMQTFIRRNIEPDIWCYRHRWKSHTQLRTYLSIYRYVWQWIITSLHHGVCFKTVPLAQMVKSLYQLFDWGQSVWCCMVMEPIFITLINIRLFADLIRIEYDLFWIA